MIGPVLALVFWTFVLWLWMYATRIPAMRKAKINPDKATKADLDLLPPGVNRIAANYNHLHEQPTVFYAVALATQIVGAPDTLSIQLAWAYVAIRVLHSLVQASGRVTIRFFVFSLGTVALIWLTVRTALTVFG
ncbi:MAG: MAPEG family protein [Hyphomonadaceae bacterium]|nr:MAPEG family protein [Hyphomonadaceae bacterium]